MSIEILRVVDLRGTRHLIKLSEKIFFMMVDDGVFTDPVEGGHK